MPSLYKQDTNHEINKPLWHIHNPTRMDVAIIGDHYHMKKK